MINVVKFKFFKNSPETFSYVLASFFSYILFVLFNFNFSSITEYFLLAILVSVFGLPHGALDTWVAKEYGIYKNNLGFFVFNLIYVTISITIIIIWLYFPVISLGGFLILSGYHFSEDWKKSLLFLDRLLLGLILISLPVFFSYDEVKEIYDFLSSDKSKKLLDIQYHLAPLYFISIPYLLFKAFIKSKIHFIELLILVMSSYFFSALIYFIIYFCFLHSIRHYRKNLSYIKKNNIHKVTKLVVFNTLVILALSAAIFFFMPVEMVEEKIIKIIFIGLAALTVPHMLLILIVDKLKLADIL